MKKYIFTESQIKKVIDSQVNEQISNKKTGFYMAHENSTTTFDNGAITKDGYLYFESEMNAYKCGPLAEIPFVYQGLNVEITKKNGQSMVKVYGGPKNGVVLKFAPNFICKKISK